MLKKCILILWILVLSLAFCGCGDSSTGNADHDYVIALMEKGDYAMAIQVLQHLQEQSGQAVTPAATGAPAEEAEPSPEPTPEATPEPVRLPEMQQLAVDIVSGFMAEKGNAMIADFEAQSASRAREPKVVHAMEYHLADFDGNGNVIHCLMVAVEADIYTGLGYDESVRLLLDMDTGAVYNSVELDENLLARGEAANRQELCTFLLNGYHSHLRFGEGVWASAELREEFSPEDLATVNGALGND